MKEGIYRVVFESSLSAFGEGIAVVSDGRVHGGDMGFTCRGVITRPVLALSVLQYDPDIPSTTGMEGNYTLLMEYREVAEGEYQFSGYVKNNPERRMTATAVYLVGLLPHQEG
ncbi:nucleoside transporter [Salmonella enterica subsp. enterica serovar Oslo]|nr:nucleoside transporter [Salmonella enterica subsp. enterica serovar Oslo]